MITEERLRVLCVDDDPDILDLLETYLTSQNMLITTAENGAAALEKLKDNEFELMISDVMMPVMGGLDLLKIVTSEYPQVATIMSTSLNETKIAIQALQNGAHDYVLKPVDFGHLTICIKNALVKQKLMNENQAYKERLESMVKEQVDVIRKQRSQLMQAERLSSLGTLISGICHEINNPLSFLKSNVELLGLYFGNLQSVLDEFAKEHPDYKLKKMTMEEVKENIKGMLGDSELGVKKIKNIIEDIMGFSRKRGDRQEVFSVSQCLESALNLARFVLKNKVVVETDLGNGRCEIMGNQQQVERVFLNLFHNAAYAMKDTNGAKLTISARESGDGNGGDKKVCIDVRDNGAGIPKEVLKQIFEPYFTTKPIGEGTGLGLAISRDIVENHKGTMVVESELNRGTVFKISFPGCKGR